jgi:hypothetical protein
MPLYAAYIEAYVSIEAESEEEAESMLVEKTLTQLEISPYMLYEVEAENDENLLAEWKKVEVK